MTQAEAVKELGRRCESERDPKVSPDELVDILGQHQRVSLFVTGGVYQIGDRVLSSTASLSAAGGVVYLCSRGGVASAEPTWPTSAGVTVVSGGVEFRFFGRHDGNPYDMPNATREAWKLKLAKATERIRMKGSGQEMEDQQIFDHCELMYRQCGPAVFVI